MKTALQFLFVLLMFATTSEAEKGILVVQIGDIDERPVAGVEVTARGASEPGITDRSGKTRIKLDPNINVHDRIDLEILKSPAGRDLKLFPSSSVLVPPFENESKNYVVLMVLDRGDLTVLHRPKRLSADRLRAYRL